MTELVVHDADAWQEPARMSAEELDMARDLVKHGESLSAFACARLLEHIRALSRDVIGLEQSLEMATGPHCSSCGNPIDPDCCWCGDGPESKHYDETHGFIPMGCDCSRYDRDWKKMACALREAMWARDHVLEVSP